MPTDIEIDDALMTEFMAVSGLKTKRGAVEAALRESLASRRQAGVRALRGQIEWVGDLDDMRTSKYIPDER